MNAVKGKLSPKKPKRLCCYNKLWELQFPWLSSCDFDKNRAKCNICCSTFTVGYDGSQAVLKHSTTKKHEKALLGFSGPSIFKIKTEDEPDEQQLQKKLFKEQVSIGELLHFYHGVKHNISYHTQDCSLKVYKQIAIDSDIIKKMTGGRTKNNATVNNVLYPFAMDLVLNDLQNGVPFSITIDSCNKKTRKFYPIIVQYFTATNGINHKVLDFFENSFDDPSSIKNQINEILIKNCLSWNNITSYSTEHFSLNFKINNDVYQKILEEENDSVLQTYSFSRVLNSCAKNALKHCSFDVENFIFKIYGEFSDANEVSDDLKEFCEFCEKEYKETIQEVPNKWLNLYKLLDKIINNWFNIKNYFLQLGQYNCPIYIWTIVEPNSISLELYIYFIHHFLSEFQDNLSQLEKRTTTSIDLHEIMSKCRDSIQKHINHKYFGPKVQSAVSQNSIPNDFIENFTLEAVEVYERAVRYLEQWYQYENITYKTFTSLNIANKNNLTYDEIIMIWTMSPWKNEVPPDELYDEYIKLQQILPNLVGNTLERWRMFFISEHAPNLLKLVQFVLSIPVSNSFTERVFNVMGNVLTDERNRICVDSLKSGLCVYFNVPYNCMEFKEAILSNTNLLTAAESKNKYNKKS